MLSYPAPPVGKQDVLGCKVSGAAFGKQDGLGCQITRRRLLISRMAWDAKLPGAAC
jgi:hypothetical protein